MKLEIKKQTMEDLMRETFSQVIQHFGEDKIIFNGKKMYILQDQIIVSVEFRGEVAKAFNLLELTAIGKYGPLDKNPTPLLMLFHHSKGPSGQEKLVNVKIIMGATGEYTAAWSDELTEDDIVALNNYVANYVQLFKLLQ